MLGSESQCTVNHWSILWAKGHVRHLSFSDWEDAKECKILVGMMGMILDRKRGAASRKKGLRIWGGRQPRMAGGGERNQKYKKWGNLSQTCTDSLKTSLWARLGK